MSSDRQLLELERMCVSFGGLRAVDDVSFAVREGSIVSLIGPNGAGKTTLFHLVSGFLRADDGRVRFDGRDLSRLPAYMRGRAGLVRTFQIPKVFARMSVLDNLILAAPAQADGLLQSSLPLRGRRRQRELRERAGELLQTFDLERLRDDYAGELSGGQRKLLELARALMARPRMLLLDEPLAGVNPTLGHTLFEHVARLRDEQGITFLFIEHDMDTVMSSSDRVIVMSQGAVIADGTPDEVRGDQRVVDAYLGSGDDDA